MTKQSNKIIASEELFYFQHNRKGRIMIEIGMPYQIDNNTWATSVSMNGLHENLKDIHGVSSLQSLALALRLVRLLLDEFILKDGIICYSDNEQDFVDLASHLGTTKVE